MAISCHLLQGRRDKPISRRVRNFETKPNFGGFFFTIQVVRASKKIKKDGKTQQRSPTSP
jgi:hypothetical protein